MTYRSPLLSNAKRSRGRLAFAASLAATCWLGAPGPAAAEESSFSLACAKRDLELIALIESQGDAQAVAPTILAGAYQDVIRARDACGEGRVAEGLAIYQQTYSLLLQAAGDEDD